MTRGAVHADDESDDWTLEDLVEDPDRVRGLIEACLATDMTPAQLDASWQASLVVLGIVPPAAGAPVCVGVESASKAAAGPRRCAVTVSRYQSPVEATWFDVEHRLSTTLVDSFAIVHCHLWAEDVHHHYVQFAFGPSEVYAEAVADIFLDPDQRIEASGEQKLRALGWLPPVRSLQNTCGQRMTRTGTAAGSSRPSLAEIVEVTVRMLRDVFWIPAGEVRLRREDCSWCRDRGEAS